LSVEWLQVAAFVLEAFFAEIELYSSPDSAGNEDSDGQVCASLMRFRCYNVFDLVDKLSEHPLMLQQW
jgi:hypothetical protein